MLIFIYELKKGLHIPSEDKIVFHTMEGEIVVANIRILNVYDFKTYGSLLNLLNILLSHSLATGSMHTSRLKWLIIDTD